MARELTAIGCNIFAGGFTAGIRRHFEVLAHLEHDNHGVPIAQANMPELPIYVGPETWPEELDVDLIYANPPCAVWSVAGMGHGGGRGHIHDPRASRVKDIYALLDRYRPKAWVWESVPRVLTSGWAFVKELIEDAEDLGYKATLLLQDAKHLGTPQQRQRFMLILRAVEVDWFQNIDWDNAPTAGEALATVKADPELTAAASQSHQELWLETPPGKPLREAFNKQLNEGRRKPEYNAQGNMRGRPMGTERKIDPDKPSPVVMGERLFHPYEPRRLSVNEQAALCGYPQNWDWSHATKSSREVSQAVCPPVGDWLGARLADAIRRGEPARAHEHVDLRREPGDRHAFRLDED